MESSVAGGLYQQLRPGVVGGPRAEAFINPAGTRTALRGQRAQAIAGSMAKWGREVEARDRS